MGHADVEVGAVEELLHVAVVERRVLVGHGLQLWLHLALLARVVLALYLNVELGEVELAAVRCALRRGVLAVHLRRVVGHGSLAPLLLCDLVRNVGAGQRAAVDAQLVADGLGEQLAALIADLDTLDAADTACERHDLANDALARPRNELVGQVEDQDSRSLNSVDKIRVRNNVLRQRHARQVLDVLVQAVDQLSELLRLGRKLRVGVVVLAVLGDCVLFLKHPHAHLLLEQIRVLGDVLANDFCDGGSPVA